MLNINIDISDKKIAVIGGGKTAYRKLKKLIDKKCCNIDLYTKKIVEENIYKFKDKISIKILKENIEEKELEKYFMVIVATDDKKYNEKISKNLNEKNIIVNNISGFGNCEFTFEEELENIVFSVSTKGVSPYLTKIIAEDFKKQTYKYKEILEIIKKERNNWIKKGLNVKEETDKMLKSFFT